jgi:hypothetical protein
MRIAVTEGALLCMPTVFEALGTGPIFPGKDHAIDYAQCRAQKSCYFTQSCFIHAKH